jgi:hypothetical protein
MKNKLAGACASRHGAILSLRKRFGYGSNSLPQDRAERVFQHIADTGHVYDGASFSCPMLANPHQRRKETKQNKHYEHHHITSRASIACDHARGLDAVGQSQRRHCFGD